jgi:N-dimethylarginine dimethylaminohydrolase
MTDSAPPGWIYNETVRMFATPGVPPFEDTSELERHWGRAWGVNNDVGRIRAILMHRPGPEMNIVDPAKRIDSIGSFGDLEKGWYFQSDTVPPVNTMQAQHDGLVAALQARGVEVHHVDGVDGGRLKSCYTRDPLIMVNGGAIVCRMGTRIRRGEELAITRTLAKLGIPILRTLSGSALMEGGSFAWINPKTAVIGCGIRVNREGAGQVAEVLKRQGVELLAIDLVGYDIHIDGSFQMIDHDLALVDPFGLPFSFLEKLKELNVRTIEITPADNKWIINSLAVAPGELIMPEGATNRTLDLLAKHNVRWSVLPYDAMQLNGGGIHCSTTPLIRDPV